MIRNRASCLLLLEGRKVRLGKHEQVMGVQHRVEGGWSKNDDRQLVQETGTFRVVDLQERIFREDIQAANFLVTTAAQGPAEHKRARWK